MKHHFLEENNHDVTINSVSYVNRIQQFREPQLQQINLEIVWFQQDGGYYKKLDGWFAGNVPGRVISRNGDIRSSSGLALCMGLPQKYGGSQSSPEPRSPEACNSP